jgi:cytosine/adenosine deaminase-related metal-dependent hydrolase
VVLIPALINAHTHLEFSDLQQPLGEPGTSLPRWIRRVIEVRGQGRRDVSAAIRTGLAESMRLGVSAIGEIATARASCYPSGEGWPRLSLFHELIGFSQGRVESVLSDALGRRQAPEEGFSPHAPYTVHPELLARVVQRAAEEGSPVAMHLAESREEIELLATGGGPFRDLLAERSMWDPTAIAAGSRPLDYLQVLARAPRVLVIHGNYLDDEERDFLAAHSDRMTLVYCPRTHAFFRHDVYPLEELIARGVRTALGTDSRASSPDLGILGEIRAAARHPAIAPSELLAMGTLHGARALGLAEKLGSLTPGKRADLVAIDCSADIDDPWKAIVAGEGCAKHVSIQEAG